PVRAIREQIASAINVIVQLERQPDGTRKVTSVQEIQGMEGDVILLQEVFKFHTQLTSDRRQVGELEPTGLRPKFAEKLVNAAILDLPYGEQDVAAAEKSASLLPFIEPGIQMTNRALERLNLIEKIRSELARARIALRPGEYVLLTFGAAFFGGLIAWLISAQ